MKDITHLMVAWADHLGIPHSDTDPPAGQGLWDGAVLHTREFGADGWDWAHEIAHWVIATPAQREHPNYKLGPDWRGGFDLEIDADDPTDQELKSSALGIQYVRYAGGDWVANAEDHSWVLGEVWTHEGNERKWDQAWEPMLVDIKPHTDAFIEWLEGRD